MRGVFTYLFFPHHSNNHRPKLLHHLSIIAVIISLFVVQAAQTTIHTYYPRVLGDTTNVQTEELLQITNTTRSENGLSKLTTSSELTQAAMRKAEHMFAHDYWAHIAPDGTTPWVFIKDAGYTYVYAGENLARGFSTSEEVTTAWMNSPTHRENVLSPNYREIGFAILQGKLQGEETTLVVEMFGARDAMPAVAKNTESAPLEVATPTSAPVVQLVQEQAAPTPTAIPTLMPIEQIENDTSVASVQSSSLFDSKAISRNMSYMLLAAFLFVLVLDMVIIERRKIVRLVGHNIDHVFFLLAISFLLFMIGKGGIL